jgi:very-short-patch-repair endonuclease
MRELPSTDAEIAALAARQYGVVAVRQLGLTSNAVALRCSSGRWHQLHRGVYAIGHLPTTREGWWLAAVLACGEEALLSHRSAATLWRMRDGEGRYPDVTARYDRHHKDIASHRAVLLEADRKELRGIPVTSPARTLADLAHVLSLDDLVRAFREAQFLRLYDRKALTDALTRRPSRALKELMENATVTQSQMEDRFLALCDRHRIPTPRTQYRIGARTLDFAWPEHRLVVETDGWQAHGTPHAFQADRTTTNALQLAGWTVLRFTWTDVTRRQRRVAETVRAALKPSCRAASRRRP